MKHLKFLSRTIFVQNNNVEEACRVLNRILGKEDIFDQYRRTRYYEKPYQVRIPSNILLNTLLNIHVTLSQFILIHTSFIFNLIKILGP